MQSPLPPRPSGSFIPADYIQERVELRANAFNMLLFVLVLGCVAAAFLVTHRQWNAVKEEHKTINGQYQAENEKIEQLKKLESQRADMIDKAEMTALLLEKIPRSVLMAEMINRLPDHVTISETQLRSRRLVEAPPKVKPGAAGATQNLSASKGAGAGGEKGDEKEKKVAVVRPPKMEYTLMITGFAATDVDVADFHRSLKDSPVLDRVDLVSSLQIKMDDLQLRKFRIEAQLKPTADVKSFQPLAVARSPKFNGRQTFGGVDPTIFMEVPAR
jgi:Tfp pilus assembly protein PilN